MIFHSYVNVYHFGHLLPPISLALLAADEGEIHGLLRFPSPLASPNLQEMRELVADLHNRRLPSCRRAVAREQTRWGNTTKMGRGETSRNM